MAWLALAACGAPAAAPTTTSSPSAPAGSAPPPTFATEADPPYPIPRAPEAKLACFGQAELAVTSADSVKTALHVELAPLPLFPVAFGARVAESPVTGRPRSVATQTRHLEAARADLHRCYRWARFSGPDLKGKLVAHYEIGPLGDVEAVTIDDAARWGELAPCVRDVLARHPLDSFTPRRTRTTVTIDFAPSGLGQPDARPEPPSRAAPAPRSGCIRALAPMPTDALEGATLHLMVDDFDAVQAALERARGACVGRPAPCHIALPTDLGGGMVATAVMRPTRSVASLRDAVESNRGAFARCWLDAKARASVGAEEVTIVASILADGRVARAAMDKPSGDAVFDACLGAAMAEIAFDGGPDVGHTVLSVTFHLFAVPPTVTPAPAQDTLENVALLAKVALVAGDGETAVRRVAALARIGRDCEVQLGLVRALLLARPWADVPVLMAANDLVGLSPVGSCRDESAEPLVAIVSRIFERARSVGSPELYEEAVERAQLVLRLGDPRIQAEVLPLLERALRALGRDDEAPVFRVPPRP